MVTSLRRLTGKSEAIVAVALLAALVLYPWARAALADGSGPKVLILEFHGMKQGILADNLSSLPHFQELIQGKEDEQAFVYFPRVFTTIQAASQPAVTSMYTGLSPQRTGVVSTIWFDRRTASVQTLISYTQERINRILAAGRVKTLFDYVAEYGGRSMTTMLMVTQGADWSLRSGAFFWGNASVIGFLRNHRWIPDASRVDEKTVSAFLSGHLASYANSLRGIWGGYRIVPDVMAVQLLGIDLFSHYPAPDLVKRGATMDEVQGYYARTVLDPLVGRLIRELKEIGCYRQTIFVLVSEHGFTRIQTRVPDDTVDKSLARGFKLPGFMRPDREAEAVIMPGACTKEIYLKNRGSGEWMDPPRLLGDVKPAVDLLLDNPDIQASMNAMVIRQYPGERHEGIAEDDQWWRFNWQAYRDSSRDDEAFLSALGPLADMKANFELGDYVVQGLTHQYTRDTAPDIQIINREGVYFEGDLSKYAHHGSYYPADCLVSFWVAGPGLARVISGRHTIEHTASTLDLAPMVTGLLGIPVPEGLDGENPLSGLEGMSPP